MAIINESGYPDGTMLLEAIIADLKTNTSISLILSKFHFTLASLILDIARKGHFSKIACNGGVFQNTTLVDFLIELAGNEFELFFNVNLAPNDENISFGQMAYYLKLINT